ncbi:metallopeptidase [Gracilibacillus boraciitolerans JCM 21714]|uniref:Metallopeptidase n=1 Tax=Gracilibacillus boraciitolerans JCM 21714 TaxID=1298598 RepID=W4VJJ4_9BACI|nr:SprT family protein [Gracilibacillus boraciitolerans]GAE93570.1 metallopeptidase [Gracilibacillus boraciitolerans JCM 21714]
MLPMCQRDLEALTNELSSQFFNKEFNDKVQFNPRLRTTGGRYIPAKRVIELNPKYFGELGYEEFVGIIKHELCHYHLHIEGKGYQHRDADFKQLLKMTNSPRHCTPPLPSMENDLKHLYKCKNCGHLYERKRRINMKRYRCGKCKGMLTLVRSTLNNSYNSID